MSADVIWVATLNADYQPTPAVSYFGIGPRIVPKILNEFRDLLEDRSATGTSTPSVLLVVDPDLDIGDLSLVAGELGTKVGMSICRAVFPSALDILGEVTR